MRSKTWLVARHEFAVTIGRLGFRIFAAAVPVLALIALIGIGVFETVRGGDEPSAAGQPSAEVTRVGYVDLSVGGDGQPLFTSFREQDGVAFTPYADEDAGSAALRAEEIDALYVFPRDFLETGSVVRVRMADSGGGAGSRGAAPVRAEQPRCGRGQRTGAGARHQAVLGQHCRAVRVRGADRGRG